MCIGVGAACAVEARQHYKPPRRLGHSAMSRKTLRPPNLSAEALFDALAAVAKADARWPVFKPPAPAATLIREWLARARAAAAQPGAPAVSAQARARANAAEVCVKGADASYRLMLDLVHECNMRTPLRATNAELRGAAHMLLMLVLPAELSRWQQTVDWFRTPPHVQALCAELFAVQVLCPNPDGKLALYGASFADGGVYYHVPPPEADDTPWWEPSKGAVQGGQWEAPGQYFVDGEGRALNPPKPHSTPPAVIRSRDGVLTWRPDGRGFLADPLADPRRQDLPDTDREVPLRGPTLPTTQQLRCQRWLERALEETRTQLGVTHCERLVTLLDPVRATSMLHRCLDRHSFPASSPDAMIEEAGRSARRPATRPWCTPATLRVWAAAAVRDALAAFDDGNWSPGALELHGKPERPLAISPARRTTVCRLVPGVLVLLDNYAREMIGHDGEVPCGLEHSVRIARCHDGLALFLELLLLTLAGHYRPSAG